MQVHLIDVVAQHGGEGDAPERRPISRECRSVSKVIWLSPPKSVDISLVDVEAPSPRPSLCASSRYPSPWMRTTARPSALDNFRLYGIGTCFRSIAMHSLPPIEAKYISSDHLASNHNLRQIHGIGQVAIRTRFAELCSTLMLPTENVCLSTPCAIGHSETGVYKVRC